jgi:hypothetical protein
VVRIEIVSAGPKGADELVSNLERLIDALGERVPSYQHILATLALLLRDPTQNQELTNSFARAFRHRTFHAFYERPLLILASLRYDALLDGPAHPLWGAICDESADPQTVNRERLCESLAPSRLGFWMTLRNRRVQTNEVSRSVCWRWPAALIGASDGKRPLLLIDVGASAGLNLIADMLDLSWIDQYGERLPAAHNVLAAARLAFDQRPLDVTLKDDVRWLQACIWPGEHQRLRQLDEAIHAFRTASPPVKSERLMASSVASRIAQLSIEAPPNALVLAYHTVLFGYLTADERERYEISMRQWLAAARPGTAAWLTLDVADDTNPAIPMHLEATVAADGGPVALRLGSTGYHPNSVHVDSAAADRFAILLR